VFSFTTDDLEQHDSNQKTAIIITDVNIVYFWAFILLFSNLFMKNKVTELSAIVRFIV